MFGIDVYGGKIEQRAADSPFGRLMRRPHCRNRSDQLAAGIDELGLNGTSPCPRAVGGPSRGGASSFGTLVTHVSGIGNERAPSLIEVPVSADLVTIKLAPAPAAGTGLRGRRPTRSGRSQRRRPLRPPELAAVQSIMAFSPGCPVFSQAISRKSSRLPAERKPDCGAHAHVIDIKDDKRDIGLAAGLTRSLHRPAPITTGGSSD